MGRPAIDLSGQRFGRLTVVRRDGSCGKNAAWLCLCTCGELTRVPANKLKGEDTKSCGCFQKEVAVNTHTTHGHSKPRRSSTYISWEAMKARCLNPKQDSYKYYGERGITVCDRWINNFENFLADMGIRPEGKTLDRRDNSGNYEPSNCRWSTHKQQIANRRHST